MCSSYQLVWQILYTAYKVVVSHLCVHFLNVLSSDNLVQKSLDIGYKEMDFSHVSFHMYFQTILCVKPFGHWLHWYGFSPVCILKCLFKKYPVWNPLHSNYSMISCWSGFLNVYWNEQFVRILLDICYNYMASRLYEFTDVFSNCILRKS